MIISFLLLLLSSSIMAFLAILPSGTLLPTSVTDMITTAVGYVAGFSWFFPINTLFLMLTVVIGYEVAIYAWHGIRWLIGLIRGGSH